MRAIRTLDVSLYEKFKSGHITLHEAAREFHKHGWTNYVDEDFTKRAFEKLGK